MSTATTESEQGVSQSEGPLSELQVKISREFVGACMARLRDNLQMLLGQPLAIELQDIAVQEDPTIRIQMPVTGAACTMTCNVDDGMVLLMMEPILAQTLLALSRMSPEDELAKMRQDAPALTPNDRSDLEEVGNFLAAAFSDEAKGRTGGKIGFEPAPVLSIKDSTWEDGADPLKAVPYVSLQGTMAIGDGGAEDPFQLFIPQSSMAAILPEFAAEESAAPPESDAPDPEPRPQSAAAPEPSSVAVTEPASDPLDLGDAGILCLAPETLCKKLEEAFVGKTTFVQKTSTLLQYLEGEQSPDLVVAFVPDEDPHVLRLISALKQHPALRGRQVLVLLESPTKRRVLRCGQLGLWNVMPAAIGAKILQARTRQLLSAAGN